MISSNRSERRIDSHKRADGKRPESARRFTWFAAARLLIAACVVAAGCAAVDRNAPIRVDDYSGRIRVACVGNSITYGEKLEDRRRDSYPAQLGRMLGNRWEVRNFGHSGATMLRRSPLPYWTQPEFREVLAYNPNVVVILLGTNDSRPFLWKAQASFTRDYEDMIETFARLPAKPRIWICDPPPLMTGPDDAWAQVLEREVIPIIDQVGLQRRVPVIDLYRPLRGQPQLFPDRVHPNSEGARLIAAEIYRALTGENAPERDARSRKRTEERFAENAVADLIDSLFQRGATYASH